MEIKDQVKESVNRIWNKSVSAIDPDKMAVFADHVDGNIWHKCLYLLSVTEKMIDEVIENKEIIENERTDKDQ